MTSTTSSTSATAFKSGTAPSRTPLLAAYGIAASAVLTAVGTFWDVTANETRDNHTVGEYLFTLGIIAVAAAVVFGLVVRRAAHGNPGRRAVVLGVVGVLSVAVFWSGLPMVLAAGALACALLRRDAHGSFGAPGSVALVLGALTTAAAVTLAITG